MQKAAGNPDPRLARLAAETIEEDSRIAHPAPFLSWVGRLTWALATDFGILPILIPANSLDARRHFMSRTARLLLPLLIGVCFSGCDTRQSLEKTARKALILAIPVSTPAQPAAQTSVAQPGDTIKICSLNVHAFGTSKLEKPQVPDVLTKVIRGFDVVASQEVGATDNTVVNSKEQHAVLFNTARIEVDHPSVYPSQLGHTQTAEDAHRHIELLPPWHSGIDGQEGLARPGRALQGALDCSDGLRPALYLRRWICLHESGQ
jgi:hypothetical protein